MKTAWILIGEANSRKSTVSRLLTGVSRIDRPVEVKYASAARVKMHAMVSAAQESRLQPVKLISKLNGFQSKENGRCQDLNFVVVLRYDKLNRCPPGEAYVDELMRAGWQIAWIVSLGEGLRPWVNTKTQNCFAIANSKLMASNHIASLIRPRFNWL